ncbi:MAG: UDP-N-acetylglucosamine 2-epimerase (non-hydrolyzing) [Firmicutes bacterium]|nr:UDP-N-acetylglucosamine 2-epimerase (non-hydrolyzing) [Bacillota bacterium]
MKVATIVGARPQFIKAAAVSKELRKVVREVLIHTGQHYDFTMSDIFFDELKIPRPDYNLGIGSGSHGSQTGKMLELIEKVLIKENPDCVLVYGDTNSTLAGALTAAKLQIPLAHVEAGLRSFNSIMPEEINRKVTDHVSSILFCPTVIAVKNLRQEGFDNVINRGVLVNEGSSHLDLGLKQPVVLNVGDVMYDVLKSTLNVSNSIPSDLLAKYPITSNNYILATIHRAENADNMENMVNIMKVLSKIPLKVIIPLHPRTYDRILKFSLYEEMQQSRNIILTDPLGYIEMMFLLNNARCVVTDSGGLQKEACMLGIPCLTCRYETEWLETVEYGWNSLIGLGAVNFDGLPERKKINRESNPYGDGFAACRITQIIKGYLKHHERAVAF